jgi:importin subunit beta-1
MDLKKVLELTVSPDQNELQAAQKFLEEAATQQFPQFLAQLSVLQADTNESPVVRQAAGIQLKNCLVAKDSSVKQAYHDRWFALEEGIRNNVKQNVFQALGTETAKPSSAASCIAGIASAELPHNLWPDLLNNLCLNTSNESSTDALKEATLEAIGYICQDIDRTYLANYSAVILRAIVTRMGNEETNNNVRFAATTAFLNSLEFIRGNFEKTDDRNYIMTITCQATTQCTDTRVKVVGLQCLVKIVSLYYEYMEPYMGPALFAITIDAMKSEEDEIVLQGVEFWSSVCDEEIDLAIEAQEAEENMTTPSTFSRFYAKGAISYLAPILLEILTKQDEHNDEEDWTPHKAAGVCLMLLASCCCNDIIPFVLPFVELNIRSADWKYRDAAVMAFGSILEGPDATHLENIVQSGMPFLLELMKDQNMMVRDSVAWALSRICDAVPDAALNSANIENLLNALIENLDSEPRVATNVCWALSSLAVAAHENAPPASEDDEEPESTVLSSKFEFIINKIIQTGDRQDAHLHNLRSSAYEAVMELVKNSPKDVYPTIIKTVLAILNKMAAIVAMEQSGTQFGDNSQHNDFKSLLCAALQATIRKLKTGEIEQIADSCMKALLQMLTMAKAGGVQEDAFLAVGTFVECVGQNFLTYLNVFKPYLIQGLQNRGEYQVCISALGVVGDLCRGIGNHITPYCDEIMQCCIENLADNSVHRSVKPHILSLFGDVALAVGSHFKKYADVVLSTLQQASSAQVDRSDYDMVDYLNELRDACLEAYTGIIQGLKGEDDKNISADVEIIKPHLEHIIKFIETIAQDPERVDNLVGACCGLLGDICTAFGAQVLPALDQPSFQELLQEGRRSKVAKTKTLAVWASKTIRNLRK